MTRTQRLALVAAAIAVAVVAFVVAQSGGDDDDSDSPDVARIALAGNKVRSGPSSIRVKKGDDVRIVVTTDKPNTIHLHGYDIEREAAPGRPARFDFRARIDGVFELESHTWEHEGLEAGISKVVIGPS